MKNKIFLALVAGFIFNSCSKDDDQPEEFSIVGVWSPSREIVVSGSDGITLSNDPASSCYQFSTFDFKDDNTLSSKIYDTEITGTCENFGTTTVPYSYDHNAKKLIIENEETEIVSRTFKELQIVSGYEDRNDDFIDDKIILVLGKK
ncbi:hypothetical protein CHRY9390_03219 [Chryseobacterium aquaeductus]|uniref:Lipocalin-like domain-containing protein n=1 Tax=Chryseobacterium aquaeductus TaxID=2675056 RepID=A0A9N8MKB3_9FLAO|nr:lipocalin family protein [Chryseobacterium aquaeductus]CAA7332496.1 hypothetical protein CHRY9390_03219 [Chryseobacterium potabilaquae]CAD7816686.1 hypothetical protein CHRY9390_03219 [Chryseobacterium aquaeductus]